MASSGARLRDPGWTPGARDVEPLLDLMRHEDEDEALAAERALLRIDARQRPTIAAQAVSRARAASRPARGRLTRLAGRLAVDAPIARAWLLEAVADADPKTRRTAARALGKLPRDPEVEIALLAAWDAASSPDDRRALAEPLGKLATPAARHRLAAGPEAKSRAMTRAALIAERSATRERQSAIGAIDLAAAMKSPVVVRFHARVGLEEIVADELGGAWRPRVAGPGLVEARLEGPLVRATEVRTATHVGFPLDPVRVEGDLAEAIVRALLGAGAREIIAAYTCPGGPVRFRLSFTHRRHRRAVVWRAAELVRAATSDLVNDPTSSTWDVVVEEDVGVAAIELVPRGFADERFAYRVKTLPASSHPTIAAALARLAPRAEGDVVWDPFVGAGAELVERARLGACARLVGTDTDRSAIDAARANLAAAGVAAELAVADATRWAPDAQVSAIITNPPMGRRVQRGAHADLLERFVAHAAEVLAPGGHLVWTVPEPRRVHAKAERAGLALVRAWSVDMGGFPAALSVHRKV